MIFQFVSKSHHVSVLVRQGEVRGDISHTRTTGGSNVSHGGYCSWCVSATGNQE
jgi:hypothetical protein